MSDSDSNVVDLTDARQRADWQAKEARAQALKKRFQKAMNLTGTAGKPAGSSKKSARRGRKKKK